MIKKPRYLSLMSLVGVSILALASCTDSNTTTNTTTSTDTSVTSTTTSDTIPDINNDDNYQKAVTTYLDEDGSTQDLNMQDLYTNVGAPHLDPLEEQHVLVVPFGFTGTDSYVSLQTDETIEKIRLTFNGTDQELKAVGGWHSVQTYYETSSYGLANVEFDVLDTWCIYENSASSLGGGANAAIYARTWYINEYAKENHGQLGADAHPLSYYDANNDGFIDLMWVVYSHPYETSGSNWWAYVTYTLGQDQTGTEPKVNTLGWASIDFMSSYNGYDAHTFVHETGHTFGLDDYYDYNGEWSPLGGIDMMDHNMGDHCAFSKFTLGWAQPWVVNKSGQIVLRSFTTSGDCFIIPSPNYNNTAFDEYFMVELLSPSGIATEDYTVGYSSTSGFSKAGLRITHVDARVYENDRDTYMTNNIQDAVGFRIDNSKFGRSGVKVDGDFWPDAQNSSTGNPYSLISIIDANTPEENGLTKYGYTATNDSLYSQGKRFIITDTQNAMSSKYLPSGTNLWNKAKTITGWSGSKQTFSVDQTMDINITLKVEKIEQDATYGYKALVTVQID